MKNKIALSITGLLIVLMLLLNSITPGFAAPSTIGNQSQVELPALQSFRWYGLVSASLNQTIGYRFTVLGEPVTITALGFYDQNGDGLTSSHQIGVWTNSGQLLTTVTVPSGTTATLITPGGMPGGGYRYVFLPTPLSLNPYTSYVIGSLHSSTDPTVNGVTDLVMNPAISFVDSRLSYNNAGFAFPSLSGSNDPRSAQLGTNFIVQAPMPPLEIDIDIKPGSDTNPINPSSNGNIPVAILSTPDFDAPSTVDTASLTFGRSGNEASLAFCNSNGEDVNGDGLLDLVCHFENQLTYLNHPKLRFGNIKGTTVDGNSLIGRDTVTTLD